MPRYSVSFLVSLMNILHAMEYFTPRPEGKALLTKDHRDKEHHSQQDKGELKNNRNDGIQDKEEQCYIAKFAFNADKSNINESQYPKEIKSVFTKWISGFEFCTDEQTLKLLKKNHPEVTIEKNVYLDDIEYRNASKTSLSRLREDGSKCTEEQSHTSKGTSADNGAAKMQSMLAFNNKDSSSLLSGITGSRRNSRCKRFQGYPSHPLHWLRMNNIGRRVFTNSLLNNVIFKIIGVTYLINRRYRYNPVYKGRGIKIARLGGLNKDNKAARTIDRLLTGRESLSSKAKVVYVDVLEKDGRIRLSRLLSVLEEMPEVDILLLTVNGPRSVILDEAIDRMSKQFIVVATAGNLGGDACKNSPNSSNIIKVGSVNEMGNISGYSPTGACVTHYALGDDILGMRGNAYSAAIVASIIAVYLEKYPNDQFYEVYQFLNRISVHRNDMVIVKMPLRVNKTSRTVLQVYHRGWLGYLLIIFIYILFFTFIFCLICAFFG